jgi:hypothetical protein
MIFTGDGNLYAEGIPIHNGIESCQTCYFIPLCLFTNYFNKKICEKYDLNLDGIE